MRVYDITAKLKKRLIAVLIPALIFATSSVGSVCAFAQGEVISLVDGNVTLSGDFVPDKSKCSHPSENEITFHGPLTVSKDGAEVTVDVEVVYCDRCGRIRSSSVGYEREEREVHVHAGGRASCTHRAVCDECKKEYGNFDKNVHLNKVVQGAKSATEDEDGSTGKLVCADCGALLLDAVAIPKAPKGSLVDVVLDKDEQDGGISANIVFSQTAAEKKATALFSIPAINEIERMLSKIDAESTYIMVSVKSRSGAPVLSVKTLASNIVKGRRLYLYAIDYESGDYIALKGPSYKVGKNGLSLSPKQGYVDYVLVDQNDAKAINDDILGRLGGAVSEVSVPEDSSSSVDIGGTFNKINLGKIQIRSTDGKVAKAKKNTAAPTEIIITGKRSGNAIIIATVSLKNGAKRRISIPVRV